MNVLVTSYPYFFSTTILVLFPNESPTLERAPPRPDNALDVASHVATVSILPYFKAKSYKRIYYHCWIYQYDYLNPFSIHLLYPQQV